ncbi:hypothetical protein BJX65DRAFT_301912 [Aspergillus insuetus]
MTMDIDTEWEKPPSTLSKLCTRVNDFFKELTAEEKEGTLGPSHQLAGTFAVVASELIEEIAFFLNPLEISFFRLTCKYIEHSTFAHCERRCLASIQTDLSHRSFLRLSDLIKEEPLAARVKKIVVTERNHCGLGKGFKWERILGTGYLNTPTKSPSTFQRPYTAWDRDEWTLLTASDAFTVIMQIIPRAHKPITAFELDF